MTGYQEILTDPSYAGQIVTFTFPHIGNVGTNDEDIETVNMAAASGVRGVDRPSRHHRPLQLARRPAISMPWLKARGIVGLAGIDTRALTALIREKGMPNAVIAHAPDGVFDIDALKARGRRPARPWTASTSCRRSPPASASTGTRRPGRSATAMAAQSDAAAATSSPSITA